MRIQLTILALVLCAVACKGDASTTSPNSVVLVTVGQGGEEARLPKGFVGTWIEILPGVEYRYATVSGVGFHSSKGAWINGHSFLCEDGWLTIGPVRYGPIADGAHVEIGGEGVFVGGAKLGDLPPAKPLSPGED